MQMIKTSLVAVVLLAGCARFSTSQTDKTLASDGKPAKQTITKSSAFTLFTSKSQLANFKALQTDKTQSTSVGALTQESSGTNAVAALQAIGEILKTLRPAP